MEHSGRRTQYGLITGIVITVLAILSVVGIYQFKRANDLALAVENQYVHSFHELTDYVKDVDVLLQKSMLVSDPRQMSALSSEIYMQTAAAKANLAQLPVSELDLSGTSKFLSQTGDYTAYLAAKVINDGTVSDAEFESLSRLSDYAGTVSGHLQELEQQLYAQQLSFNKVKGMTAYAAGGDFAGGMEGIEQAFQDYPALIYDGPFSEHIETMEPVMLKNKVTVSRDAALAAAQVFIKGNRAGLLTYSGEGGGSIPTYDFTGTDGDGREICISVTKQGGYILYFLDNREPAAEKLSIQEAIGRASAFLKESGFADMQNSYYEKEGNTATVNFAAVQNGVILYSDLIKVKVALDNGEILGIEAKGYLMSHEPRQLPERSLSESEARAKINSHLSVDTVRPALIPLDSKREVLTYECKGTYKDKNFLIYINALTGQEEKILMLLESEDGILTI